ncbi:hypothetical protein PR048_000155 [Dryococelus australis]|uniref:Peptidase A2 domain-containing protein n=1 Tax=Dryococelus australis TaxID=614101 RepID=A0ABQ9IG23_9NEOP|nr:hypothetical protein PR048_000155 [Dryococelus australis]
MKLRCLPVSVEIGRVRRDKAMCEKVGHYGKCCRSKGIGVQDLGDVKEEDQYYYIGEVAVEVCSDLWYIQLKVQGVKTMFKIATGADMTVIGKDLSGRLGLLVKRTAKKVFGAGKNPIQVEGTARVHVPPLGRPAIRALDIVAVRVAEVRGAVNSHEYYIRLQKQATRYAVVAPKRVALPLREKLNEELDRMLKEEVITPVHSPTEWCAQIVVIPEKMALLDYVLTTHSSTDIPKRERL